MPRAELKVLLVDDHALVRRGFRRMLEDEDDIRVVGEASDGHVAVEAAEKLKPDVVVMDFALPSMNGAVATSQHPRGSTVFERRHREQNKRPDCRRDTALLELLAPDQRCLDAWQEVFPPWGL